MLESFKVTSKTPNTEYPPFVGLGVGVLIAQVHIYICLHVPECVSSQESTRLPMASAAGKLPADEENYKSRAEAVQRAQWLRAAILGANDGLLSTTSLMLGVGAVKEDRWSMVLSGLAGAVAGACSMAVGEFVSVSTQRDIENSISTKEGSMHPEHNHNHSHLEIKIDHSPMSCGRSPVMKVMMEQQEAKNNDESLPPPNPYKAAGASAFAFLCGSLVPLVAAIVVEENMMRNVVIVLVASIALVVFGGVGAKLGGSSVKASAVRVVMGGWMAMGVTYGLLKPFDRDDGNGSGADRD